MGMKGYPDSPQTGICCRGLAIATHTFRCLPQSAIAATFRICRSEIASRCPATDGSNSCPVKRC